jgi:hypothetical protein
MAAFWGQNVFPSDGVRSQYSVAVLVYVLTRSHDSRQLHSVMYRDIETSSAIRKLIVSRAHSLCDWDDEKPISFVFSEDKSFQV